MEEKDASRQHFASSLKSSSWKSLQYHMCLILASTFDCALYYQLQLCRLMICSKIDNKRHINAFFFFCRLSFLINSIQYARRICYVQYFMVEYMHSEKNFFDLFWITFKIVLQMYLQCDLFKLTQIRCYAFTSEWLILFASFHMLLR